LGFDIADTIVRGMERMDEKIAEAVAPRTTVIHALPAGQDPPKIDGALDDPAWNDKSKQQPFVNIAGVAYSPVSDVPFIPIAGKAERKPNAGMGALNLPAAIRTLTTNHPKAPTTTWVTYDRNELFIAFRCEDPLMNRIRITGSQRDGEIWRGDMVEVFVSLRENPNPYRQFMVNPRNVQWDGRGGNPGWNGNWRSAAKMGKDHWTVEIAIPWKLLGGCPHPDSDRRANLCRQRTVKPELSSWSPVVTELLEPQRFGIWRFAK